MASSHWNAKNVRSISNRQYVSAYGTVIEFLWHPQYHYLMRHIVFVILIALLPLRSWAGDAMAIQMAAQATVKASADTENADCMEHRAATDDHASDILPGADGHCNTCAACQACSAVALAFDEIALSLTALPHSTPSWAAAHFTSADRKLGQKPPIS